MLVQIEDVALMRRMILAKRLPRDEDVLEQESTGGEEGLNRDKPKRRTKKTKSTVLDKPAHKGRDTKPTKSPKSLKSKKSDKPKTKKKKR